MSNIYTWDDPSEDDDIIGTLAGQNKMNQRLSATAQQQVAIRAAEIYKQNPWMDPGVVLALAKSGANDQTVANVSGLAAGSKDQQKKKNNGFWAKVGGGVSNVLETSFKPIQYAGRAIKFVGTPIAKPVGKFLQWATPDAVTKPAVRYAVATLDTGKELLHNSPRIITGQTVNPEAAAMGLQEEESRAGWWASTTLGTMSDIGGGSGFLPSEEVRQEQGRRAREYRGTMPDGRAFTGGRGYAYSLNLEGKWGNIVSGVIDGVISLSTPDNIVLPELASTTRALRGTDTEIYNAVNAMGVIEGTAMAAGISGDLVEAPKFLNWINRNRYAQRLVKKLTETNSSDEVMRLMSDRITPEDAIRFANADTEDKVIGLFQQLVSRERLSEEYFNHAKMLFNNPDGTLDTAAYQQYLDDAVINTEPGMIGANIKDLQGARRELLRSYIGETRLHQWIDKWTAEVPSSQILIRGDDRQRSEAVKNLRNYLRTVGGRKVNMSQRDYIVDRVQTLVDDVASNASIPTATKDALGKGAELVKDTIDNLPKGQPLSARKSSVVIQELTRLKAKAFESVGPDAKLPESLSDQFDELIREVKSATGKTIEVSRAQQIMDRFIGAVSDLPTAGRQQAFAAREEIIDLMADTMQMNGIGRETIEKFLKANKDAEEIMRKYWTDASGDMTGQAFLKALYDAGLISKKQVAKISANPSMMNDIGLIGPSTVSDLLNNAFFLPEARLARRFASPFWGRALREDAGALTRGAVATGELFAQPADFLVTSVWKRTSLLTGGYIMRNVLDGQLRVALLGRNGVGMVGFMTHPVDYFVWAMGRVGKGGILGQSWEEAKAAYLEGMGADDIADAASAELVRNLGRSGHRQVMDIDDASVRMQKNGVFFPVSRADNDVQHTTGVVDALGQIHEDLGLRLAMEGRSTEEFLQIVRKPENRQYLKDIIDLFSRGFKYKNPMTRLREDIPIYIYDANGRQIPGALDEALTFWYENVATQRILPYKVADPKMEKLRFAALYDKVLTPKNMLDGPESMAWADARVQFAETIPDSEVPEVGMIVRPADPANGINDDVIVRQVYMMDIIDETSGEIVGRHYEVDLHTAHPGMAFGGEALRGTKELRNAIDSAGGDGLLPEYVRYAQRQSDMTPELRNQANMRARQVTNWFFGKVSDKAMRNLEKYPFWRQGYYDVVKQNVDMLSPQEAQRVIDTITEAARKAGISPEDYVGREAGYGKFIQKRIARSKGEDYGLMDMLRRQAAEGTGTGTAEQLSQYAGTITNMNMSNIFFEAAMKNNIEDALRVIYPFGSAWREIFTKYAAFFVEDPYRAAKVYRAYRAGSSLDPDGDGRGWFYRDPQSGELMFQFPGSNFLGRAVTAMSGGTSLDVGLEAPLKQLNVGFQMMPSMGPLAQIPASMILKDKPELSGILHMIAPYGAPSNLGEGAANMLPGWMRKAAQVWQGNTEDMNTTFAQTYVDTLRALYASGEYELTSKDGEDALLRDAKIKARAIMGLRVASQFIGPTSGSAYFQVKDKEGRDIYVDVLAQELATLREEDYDTAVSRFLDAHGENFMLYLASKTRATDKGQGYEPTEEFMNWTIENKNFLDRYQNTGAYFGPTSDNFSFEAYDYQIRTGKRVYNDDREIIAQAQYVTAAERYRQERLKYGPYPNEIEREKLKQVRISLNAQFPAYPVNPVFEVNKFQEVFIPELSKAAADPKAKDYAITPFVQAYLDARSEAIAALGGSAGTLKTAKRAARVRSALAYYGQQLAKESTEFARLYDRHLAAEVED